MTIKKWISTFVLMGCTVTMVLSMGCTPKKHEQKQATFLETVCELITALGLPACSDLKSCVDVTQKEFLRATGKELWEIKDPKMLLSDVVMPFMHTLGFVDERYPQQQQYEYVVVIGATVASMRHRLALLADYWQKGIRFKHIVLLAGQRPLDQKKELDLLISEGVASEALPTTEYEAILHVFKEAVLPIDLRAVPVTVANAPCVMQQDGTCKRPSMADTIDAWLATSPTPGSLLAIAHQPFCLYSQVVLRTSLPLLFSVETVGSKAAETTTVAVYLDSLSRVLYQAHTSGYMQVEPLL